MQISKILKGIQFNLLRQSGVNVTPEQFGLKVDPNPQFGNNNGFSGILAQIAGVNGTTSGQQSQLAQPTPPEDLTDTEAVAQYHEDMAAYNQQMHANNQQMMQLLMQQFAQLQQQLARVNSGNNSSSVLSNNEPLGIGGIIDGFDET